MTKTSPVLKGTLDILVLKALAWQPMHGFELTTWLEERSRNRLSLEDAALYQALYRLEKRRLIAGAWGVTEQKRRARYYEIKPAGERFLAEQTAWWLRYAETVTGILTTSPGAA